MSPFCPHFFYDGTCSSVRNCDYLFHSHDSCVECFMAEMVSRLHGSFLHAFDKNTPFLFVGNGVSVYSILGVGLSMSRRTFSSVFALATSTTREDNWLVSLNWSIFVTKEGASFSKRENKRLVTAERNPSAFPASFVLIVEFRKPVFLKRLHGSGDAFLHGDFLYTLLDA